jgi:hypothetical protein
LTWFDAILRICQKIAPRKSRPRKQKRNFLLQNLSLNQKQVLKCTRNTWNSNENKRKLETNGTKFNSPWHKHKNKKFTWIMKWWGRDDSFLERGKMIRIEEDRFDIEATWGCSQSTSVKKNSWVWQPEFLTHSQEAVSISPLTLSKHESSSLVRI